MAAMLSGLPGMVVGVGATITDSGARVDSCALGVSLDPDSESSGRDIADPGARVDSCAPVMWGVVKKGKEKVLQGKGFWFHYVSWCSNLVHT